MNAVSLGKPGVESGDHGRGPLEFLKSRWHERAHAYFGVEAGFKPLGIAVRKGDHELLTCGFLYAHHGCRLPCRRVISRRHLNLLHLFCPFLSMRSWSCSLPKRSLRQPSPPPRWWRLQPVVPRRSHEAWYRLRTATPSRPSQRSRNRSSRGDQVPSRRRRRYLLRPQPDRLYGAEHDGFLTSGRCDVARHEGQGGTLRVFLSVSGVEDEFVCQTHSFTPFWICALCAFMLMDTGTTLE